VPSLVPPYEVHRNVEKLGNLASGEDSVSGIARTYERVWVGVSLSRQIIERLAASLSYRYTVRDSDQPGRDYRQNQVTLALDYKF